MTDFVLYRIPIRVRLTLWYVLLMAATFTALALYLTARFQDSLRNAIDASLQITLQKTIAALDEEDYRETNRLTFDNAGQAQAGVPDFGMRLLSVQGEVWDSYGAPQNVPLWGPAETGFTTQKRMGGEEEWRVLSQPVLDANGQPIGWVQAARSLQSLSDTLQDLREQLLWGIPLILLMAGFGGYFLADRALQPVEEIANTAEEITARDLSRRLAYRGPADEVGRLAQTFDEMLERLQSAFEHERRFTGDAAHELRTPLTVLKGQIEVALSRPRKAAEYEKKLRELSTQVDRLIHLSSALLFLSRTDQNQLAWEPGALNLRELLEVIIEQIRPLACEKELTFTMDIAAELPVYGDADHLIRLFLNLVENAVKYTPIGGQITVEALREPAGVQVAIHNSGTGIAPEHLPRLFERFYRLDADRSSQTGGAGLGLAIAREIVRLHGGEISAQSEPGRGITFVVQLPAPMQ